MLLQFHQRTKNFLRRSGLGDAALHIHLGFVVWLGFVATLGHGNPGSTVALAALFAVEAANELMDRLRKGAWHARETAVDFVQTVIWPVMVYCLVQTGCTP